jgi:hypothetical protein
MVPQDPEKDDPWSKKSRDWLSVFSIVANVGRIIVDLAVLILR